MEELQKNILSNPVRWVMYVLAGCIVIFFIYEAGVFAGIHRTRIAYRSPREAERAVPGFLGFLMPHLLVENDHGTVGIITAIALPKITITSRGGAARTVLVGTTTALRADTGNASSSALAVGEAVVAIGMSDASGTIDADLIRILPQAPTRQ